MENASKALIIAGAILLAILIIGLGMAVFNNIKDIANPNLDSEKIQTINSPLSVPSSAGYIKGRVSWLIAVVVFFPF